MVVRVHWEHLGLYLKRQEGIFQEGTWGESNLLKPDEKFLNQIWGMLVRSEGRNFLRSIERIYQSRIKEGRLNAEKNFELAEDLYQMIIFSGICIGYAKE